MCQERGYRLQADVLKECRELRGSEGRTHQPSFSICRAYQVCYPADLLAFDVNFDKVLDVMPPFGPQVWLPARIEPTADARQIVRSRRVMQDDQQASFEDAARLPKGHRPKPWQL